MMVRRMIIWLLAITLTLGLSRTVSAQAGHDEGKSERVEKVEKEIDRGRGHKHQHARIERASKEAEEHDRRFHERHARVKKMKEEVAIAAEEAEEREEARERFFNSQRRGLIHKCYAPAYQGSLPPGLQMQVNRTGHLPPGLEMQLRRNGHLPPGLEKKLRPASPELTRCLGPLPPGTKLFSLGRDAVLINERVGSIVDVMRGFYPVP